MIDRNDTHIDYYLVRTDIHNLGDLIVSTSPVDKAVMVVDDINDSYYYLPTYRIEYVYQNGVWINDIHSVGSMVAFDCETTEMIEIERTEDQYDLPVGFRSLS